MSTHVGPALTDDGFRTTELAGHHMGSHPTRVGRGGGLPAGVGLRGALSQGSDEAEVATGGPPRLHLGPHFDWLRSILVSPLFGHASLTFWCSDVDR